jgi:hypothetical protein
MARDMDPKQLFMACMMVLAGRNATLAGKILLAIEAAIQARPQSRIILPDQSSAAVQ